MRLLICGGRDFNDRKLFRETMEGLQYPIITAIIHGGAKGADTLADLWGKKYGVPVIRMDALWEAYGKKAGSMRNQAMLDLLQPDAVLAFPGWQRYRRHGATSGESGAAHDRDPERPLAG